MVHGTPVPQVSEDSAGDCSPRDTTRCVTRYSRYTPAPVSRWCLKIFTKISFVRGRGGDYYYGNGGTSSPQITPHTFEMICLLMKSVKKLILKTTQLTTTYYFRDCIIKVFSTWQLILFLSCACREVWALLSFSVTLNSLRSPPPPLVSILQIRQCRPAARWAVWTTISAVTPGTFLHSFPLLVPQF